MERFFTTLPIWLNVFLFFAGFLIIIKGADWFVGSAVTIAEATGIPKIVIGATIVSVATTFPEFCVSFIASLMKHPGTAVGNSIGSAVCNIGLILGTSVLVKPMVVQKKTALRQGAFMIAAGVLVTLLAIDGQLSHLNGLLLLVGLVCYIWYSVRRSAKQPNCTANNTPRTAGGEWLCQQRFSSILRFCIGGLSVGLGSVLLVQNAAVIARWLGVPELIIALTLVSVGTSLPEYVTSLTAIVKGHGDLGVGNVLGADVLDILWVLGASSLVRPLSIQRQTQVLDFPFMLLLMGLCVLFSSTGQRIYRWQGATLFGIYAIYLLLMFHLFT
ncbi:MAG: sodium:calcium antiporter [Candidatus Latescibacterota bacterium]|nr:MAG: sodium:calcium antiporter [Candidatus Latescibacterota bacterium]